MKLKKKSKKLLSIAILLLTTLATQSCLSNKQELVKTSYKNNLCSWLKPLPQTQEPYEELIPNELIIYLARAESEYQAICLTIDKN